MDLIREEERDLKGLLKRIKTKNFKGNSGQAIKNSSYQLTQSIVMKIGSLLFTLIIARILLPEKMGLYSLALATIVLFSSFSDLGIGSAVMTYCSKMLGKNDNQKAKGYLKKLLRWKIVLVSLTTFVLLLSSYFIANNYYDKPIFYALLAGGIYLPFVTFLGFLENVFKTNNDFKRPLIKEILFQFLRITLVPLGILFLLNFNFSNEILISFVILLLSFCYFVTLLFLKYSSNKIGFLSTKAENLNEKETKDLKKFILPLSAMALSGMFFGYIDTIMLGHFVSSSFIAYYSAAFSLAASVGTILGFTAIALMPLFSKLKDAPLEKLFVKTRNVTFLLAVLAGILMFFLSGFAIKIAYGSEYLQASPILKYFTIVILLMPIISLYLNYYVSQKKTKLVAWLLIGSTLINIILNYVGINYGLRFGEFEAVLGACFATIISRIFYLVGLGVFRRRKGKLFN